MSASNPPIILAFGAHPDDIEFGCGAVVALETQRGATAKFAICTKGEAGTNGTPETRVREAEAAASILGATVEWIEMEGDAHLLHTPEHSIRFARLIRTIRPSLVLAPAVGENQHPDHVVVGKLARDAARLARFGGLSELKDLAPHSIDQLLYFAITKEGEPSTPGVMIDVSARSVQEAWTRAMQAHASQMKTRNYLDLQLTRARLNGLRCGVESAITLYPNDTLMFDSVFELSKSSRRF